MCAAHQKEEGARTRNWTECFDQPFSHADITHSVFCLHDGTGKPPVLLLHDLVGLSPGTCISGSAKQHTLRKEFDNRFISEEIPASEYQRDGKPVKAHSMLIGAWRAHGEAGQPSRDVRESGRAFLLKELGQIRPPG